MNRVNASTSTNAIVVGFALGLAVAIPAIVAAVMSGGAGYGDYALARLLFPLPMLLTLIENDSIGALSISVGLLQFPIYGALLSWSIARKNYALAGLVVLAHTVAALVCFTGTLPNFSGRHFG